MNLRVLGGKRFPFDLLEFVLIRLNRAICVLEFAAEGDSP
jgi:hypothetical protein